jgi:hypothetical protein
MAEISERARKLCELVAGHYTAERCIHCERIQQAIDEAVAEAEAERTSGVLCKYCDMANRANPEWSVRYFRADTTPAGMWWHKDGERGITMPCTHPNDSEPT